MKSHLHANASVSKWQGSREDYIEIHEFLDSTKAHHADMRHRALLHNSWGIFLVERIFGRTIINSSGKEVSTRDIAEHHIIEDLGRIPSVGDYLNNMVMQPWMGGKKSRRKKITFNLDAPKAKKPLTEPSVEEELGLGKILENAVEKMEAYINPKPRNSGATCVCGCHNKEMLID